MTNLLIFQKWVPVLFLRSLAASSRVFKKDYPWSDDLEKLLDPLSYLGRINRISKFTYNYSKF